MCSNKLWGMMVAYGVVRKSLHLYDAKCNNESIPLWVKSYIVITSSLATPFLYPIYIAKDTYSICKYCNGEKIDKSYESLYDMYWGH